MTEAVSPSENSDRFYIPQLDGLRALAVFLVFLFHVDAIPVSPQWPAFFVGLLSSLNQLMTWGWVGVEIFFVLSAYLITTLLLKEREKFGQVSFRKFFIRRALRIWPLYYFIILLGFLILPALNFGMPLGGTLWHEMVSQYLAPFILFICNFWFTNPSMGTIQVFLVVAWSVAMEEQFYLVWGLVMSRLKDMKTVPWIIGIGMIFTIALRGFIQSHSETHRAYYCNTLSHLDPILIGIALALLLPDLQKKLDGHRYQFLLVALPLLSYVICALFTPNIHTNTSSMIWLLTLTALNAALLLSGCILWQPCAKLFGSPFLTGLGQLTYGMYFYHGLAQLFSKIIVLGMFPPVLISDPLRAWFLYFSLGLFLTWLMAKASWALLEKRFYELRQRHTVVPSGFTGNPLAEVKN